VATLPDDVYAEPSGRTVKDVVAVGSQFPLPSAYTYVACPHCRRLLVQTATIAWSRALLSAGRSIAARRAMMPMMTRSSTKVKPDFPRFIFGLLWTGAALPDPLRKRRTSDTSAA
jgi:hypothetical protein